MEMQNRRPQLTIAQELVRKPPKPTVTGEIILFDDPMEATWLEKREKAARLLKAGMCPKEVARVLNMSVAPIYQWRKKR